MWPSRLSFRSEILHCLNSLTGIPPEMHLMAEARNSERWRCTFETRCPLRSIFSITRTVVIVKSFLLLSIQAEGEQRVQKLCGTRQGTDRILGWVLLSQDDAFQQEKLAKRKLTALPSRVTARTPWASHDTVRKKIRFNVQDKRSNIRCNSLSMEGWWKASFLQRLGEQT